MAIARSLDHASDPPRKLADVITLGNILHDWDLDKKLHLLRAAYAALPEGGVLLAVENIIDDDRQKNAFGLLMSLNMLIETDGGFDYTGADFAGWAKAAGFKDVRIQPLAGPSSVAIAYKCIRARLRRRRSMARPPPAPGPSLAGPRSSLDASDSPLPAWKSAAPEAAAALAHRPANAQGIVGADAHAEAAY
jgi:hypothetical protein